MSEIISIANAPRDLAALSQLTRRQLYMLADGLRVFYNDAELESAFLAQGPESQAATVLLGLQNHDRTGAVQQSPQQQQQQYPQQLPVAPQAPQMPQMPQQMQQYAPPAQQQFQQPPSMVMPPPVPPPQAPQQYQMQPAVQQHVPPPQYPMQPPQAPQYQMQPPMQPPQVPQAQAPQMQQYAAPPYHQMPPVAPQMAPPPPAPMAPAPPPPVPSLRQPQTTADPSNSGVGASVHLTQLTNALMTLQQANDVLGGGLQSVLKQVNGSVLIQRTILHVMLTMAELQGITAEQLARHIQMGDPEAVQKFLSALGAQQGKG